MPKSSPVIIVTGAATGIGAATAKVLAHGRPRLLLHARAGEPAKAQRLAETAATCESYGAEVWIATGDLGTEGIASRVIAAAVERWGTVDQIVSNAGFADRRGTDVLTRADLDRSYAVMAAAFLELAQAARPHLVRSARGRIVLVSSFVAHRFVDGGLFPASAAAKAAAEALARSLAAELAPHRVTVNTVIPGYTRKNSGTTALAPDAWRRAEEATPMRRLAEPVNIAGPIAFLLSDAASHITGQAIAVDGGLSLGNSW